MADTLPSSIDLPLDESVTVPLFSNLPNDVALQCLARVPRFHHPSLALVCKSWHSVLRSRLFYLTRKALNVVDYSLYVNLRLPATDPNNDQLTSTFKWFILRSSSTSIARNLVPIPSSPSTQPIGASIVSLGSKIYLIGGSVGQIPTRTTSVYDSIFNRWEIADPQMRVAREFAAAGTVNGKIYVMGGCPVNNRARIVNWAEVFDPETESWAAIPSPDEVREGIMHASVVAGGKIYAMADRGGVVFNPGSGEWGCVPKRLDMGWRGRAGVVDGVVYCYDYLGKIKGFDLEENVWKVLRGVEKGLPKFLCGATLANVGGKLVVVWEEKGNRGRKEMEIRGAEIEVWKDGGNGELWGSICWCDVVLVAPAGSVIVNCLAVEL